VVQRNVTVRWLIFLTHIRQVPGSHPYLNTDYPDCCFHDVPQSLQASVWVVHQPRPSTSLQNHYTLVIVSPGPRFISLSEHRLSRLLFPRCSSVTTGICLGSTSTASFHIPSESLHIGHCITRIHSKPNRSFTHSRLDPEDQKLPTPAPNRCKSHTSSSLFAGLTRRAVYSKAVAQIHPRGKFVFRCKRERSRHNTGNCF
jgi:hypothetical protein